jgi:hypothetical protein
MDQRRHRLADRRRPAAVDLALQPRQRRVGRREGRRPVLEFGHDALGELGADTGGAADHRLVLQRDRIGEFARRQRRQDGERHLRAHPLHVVEQAEPGALSRGGEAHQPDRVLAHQHLGVEHRFLAGGRQGGERFRRAEHVVADPAHVEDHPVLAVCVDDAPELADHA